MGVELVNPDFILDAFDFGVNTDVLSSEDEKINEFALSIFEAEAIQTPSMFELAEALREDRYEDLLEESSQSDLDLKEQPSLFEKEGEISAGTQL